MLHKQLRLRFARIMIGAVSCVLLALLEAAGQERRDATAPAAPAFFESKVRPLLLSSCVSCHGKESAQGGLRLDVPVAPEKAPEILRRVRGEGGKPRMPLGGTLSPDRIAALETWVRQGAVWPAGKSLGVPGLQERGRKHWAFQPVIRPKVPTIRMSGWVRTPIDAFVLKRLEAQGLKPARAASRRDLLRRLTYDLTGLPPTPEAIAAFEADRSPNAYERVVDRLLESPHYGEQWGRHWLDLVRYAETNSYERDNPKPQVTKFRDYVIRAFNDDKPYNRFIREQLAGDEFPDAAGDALLATAYYRLGIWDDEPADKQQAVFDDLDDLITTTGQTFLGLTLDCARCHDHKLDPILQADYYRFVSFFQNINRFQNGGPTDEAPYFATPEERREHERKAAEWESRRSANRAQSAEIEKEHGSRRSLIMHAGDLVGLQYRYFEGNFKRIPRFDSLKPVLAGTLQPAFLDLRPRKRREKFGFVFEGELNIPQDGDYAFSLLTDGALRLTIGGTKRIEKAAAEAKGSDSRVVVHLAAGRVPIRLDYAEGPAGIGLSVAWSGPGFARRALTTLESCEANGLPQLLAAELPLVLGAEKADRYARLIRERAEIEKQEPQTEKVLCVTEAGPSAPETFILQRGLYTTPGEKVEPAFPACVAGAKTIFPKPAPGARTTGRRTVLANWIASADNPLTARVIVNRIWQHHFGRGIVRTPSDFGLQGAPPTHPELLDWLASEFVTRGWSFKALHRLILTSNTYKQSSLANPDALAKDPQNDLCWRFDMRRLSAEEIRDSVLAVSGALNPALYGPCIYPEIPKEILAGQSRPGNDWYTDKMKPEDLNRRSIYIHVKRSLLYPLLAGFDLPETDRTAAVRFASTQPTQALALLNGPFINQQAAVLATQVRREAGSESRAFTKRLLQRVLQRTPTGQEILDGTALLERLQKRGAKPEQAQQYLGLMALNLNEFFYLD